MLQHVIKPNACEACRAAGIEYAGEPTLDQAQEAGERLLEQTDARAVVVTMGAEGVLVIAPEIEVVHVPGVRVEGPIDIVGAGDSFTAGMVATLAVRGTGWGEAAMVGNLVASITIQQLGTTGVATPEQRCSDCATFTPGAFPAHHEGDDGRWRYSSAV